MRLLHACSLLVLLLIGCSEPPAPHVVVEQTVTVKTTDDAEKSVPVSELYDHSTGEPSFHSVLVFDRQANRKLFVSPDALRGQNQANARYVLVTSSPDANTDGDG